MEWYTAVIAVLSLSCLCLLATAVWLMFIIEDLRQEVANLQVELLHK